MAVVLIVEDGSVVPNANSYSDLIFAREYAESRGIELPLDDEELSVSLINGYDLVNSYRAEYKGSKVGCEQTGAWPRCKVVVEGCALDPAVIPLELKQANVVAASLHGEGVEFNPVSDGKETASERVEGAVTVSYFESGSLDQKPILNAVNSLVEPYLRNSSGMILGTRI